MAGIRRPFFALVDSLVIDYSCRLKGGDMKKLLLGMCLAFMVLLAAGAGVIYSGVVSVAADDPHGSWVHGILETARERSIESHASDIAAPPLDDEAMKVAGAGNYASMCASCHLAPGMQETELSKGLYPSPPNFVSSDMHGEPEERFWVIKHGIKASGMPAWGKSMQDEYIWQMVAFMQELPDMSAARYTALVAASDGHQHGGGETAQSPSSHHDDDTRQSHHAREADGPADLQDSHEPEGSHEPKENHEPKDSGRAEDHPHSSHDAEHQH